MKSLSILCQKGGVGKTTIVVNIAKIYSNNGIKTLIVDLDPQGNTSTYLDFDKQKKINTYFTGSYGRKIGKRNRFSW